MDPFVAEIRMFPFEFAPKGWALCNGQLLPISQNTALFALLGTVYGGDGKSNFALPNLIDATPIGAGSGFASGLTDRVLGEQSGSQTVTLLVSEMPAHTHTVTVSRADSIERSPTAQLPAGGVGVGLYANASASGNVTLNPAAYPVAGSSFPHNNMQPYLALNFCIAMQGVYPQRP